MKAVCWYGTNDVWVETVPDPKIINPRDAILKVTSATICGSDLHIYDGYIPTMEPGDIIGHEFMGEIVDIGNEVKKLKKGDRVVVSSMIACGHCWYCQQQMWSLCDNLPLTEAKHGFELFNQRKDHCIKVRLQP